MDLLQQLNDTLGNHQILTGEAVSNRFSHIWEADRPLNAKAVLLPRNTEEVSHILRICHEHGQPIIIHGGLTNLVGATEAQEDQLVISLEKMNNIQEVDTQSRTITVQAGVILENIQKEALAHKLLFPLNFGAKGSAQIGGIISTNAGGLRVLRYGMTRDLVLGLQAVMADGTIIDSHKKMIKDNTGYDLKQLFIGSEGTLGIVTQAVLKLYEAPNSRCGALVALNSYQNVVEFLKYIDQGLAGLLSAFELMWNITYRAQTADNKAPIDYQYPYYVLLESLGSEQQGDQERLFHLLEKAQQLNLIKEAVPATSASELERIWEIREQVDRMVGQCRNPQHFDISLPIAAIGPLVDQLLDELMMESEVIKVFPFGHVADGNIHLVVDKKEPSDELTQRINEIVYAPLNNLGGSISAEHGIGLDKKPYLKLSRSTEEIALMNTLKRTLDPQGILNPGRILD